MATNKDLVTGLYVAIYDRAPDAAGRGNWLAALDAGSYHLTSMAQAFIDAAPVKFSQLYSGKTSEQIVQTAYNNILSRDGEPAGVSNWTAFLEAHGEAAFFGNFVEAALDYNPATDTVSDAATKAAATTAQQALSNKVSAGNYFADTLGDKSNGAIDSAIYNQSVQIIDSVTDDPATLNAARSTVDNLNGSIPGNTVLTPDNSGQITATAGEAEILSFSASELASGNYVVTGFTAGEDSLRLDLDNHLTGDNLLDLSGQQLATGLASVQLNQITGSLFVNLGNDASGNLISLELNGVSDPTQVDLILV